MTCKWGGDNRADGHSGQKGKKTGGEGGRINQHGMGLKCWKGPGEWAQLLQLTQVQIQCPLLTSEGT